MLNVTSIPGIGWGMIIVSGVICIYYNLIISWVLHYLAMSLRADVPWKTCSNEWNTDNCTTRIRLTNDSLSSYINGEDNTTKSSDWWSQNGTNAGQTSAAEEFWQ
jgi:solute carrier family 6 amino acid transporter-like protein 5/7/9/14